MDESLSLATKLATAIWAMGPIDLSTRYFIIPVGVMDPLSSNGECWSFHLFGFMRVARNVSLGWMTLPLDQRWFPGEENLPPYGDWELSSTSEITLGTILDQFKPLPEVGCNDGQGNNRSIVYNRPAGMNVHWPLDLKFSFDAFARQCSHESYLGADNGPPSGSCFWSIHTP